MSQMFCFLGIEPLTKDDSVKSYVQTVIDSFGHAKKNKLQESILRKSSIMQGMTP